MPSLQYLCTAPAFGVELRENAAADRRRYEVARERLADSDPAAGETYEEMMTRCGLDPDEPV